MLRVSPSVLGNYFFLDCERMLRYKATTEDQREKDGIPELVSNKSVVTQAIIERGRNWEEKVVAERLKDSDIIAGATVENARPSDRVLPYKETISCLKSRSKADYIYQPHLEPPRHFYKRYGIEPSQFIFSPCRPDLIQIKKESKSVCKLRITDIKASDKTKFSHCIQTALYAIILRDILDAEGIRGCEMDMEACNIWLLDQDRPELFEMSRIIEPLEAFIQNRLPGILLQPAQNARWSLSPHCEWCEYLEYCREEAENNQDISILPYFPKQAKYFLNEFSDPVKNIPELQKFLQRDDAVQICRTCGSLIGVKEQLTAKISAMSGRIKNEKGQWRGGEAVPFGRFSVSLPKGQHIGVVLTLHQDPITGGIFAAGLHVQGGKEIHGQEMPWTVVAQTPTDAEYQKVVALFLERLGEIMRAVHEYNSQQEDWTDQKSLQCYVYDYEEKQLLDELLANAVKIPELAERALTLFFYFQSERLADSSWHASNEVPFPLLVVLDAIRDLVALPIPVSYKLSSVSVVLKPSMYASFYSPKGEYSFPYSNRLKTDAIFQAWKSEDPDIIGPVVTDIKYELEKRLKATFSILGGLRERVGENLFAYPPKFFLPGKSDFKNPILSKLAFLTRYEEVLEYLEIHASRTSFRGERLESGNAIRIQMGQCLKPGHWEAALAPESAHIIPEASGYSEWLLSRDDDIGDRDQMGFPDFWYREQHWVPKKIAICFASIEGISNRGTRTLYLEIKTGANSPALTKGGFYLLHRRYTDFISKRIVQALRNLDSEAEGFFLSLIQNPHKTLAQRQRSKKFKQDKKMAEFLQPFGFTESQKSAFIRICENNFQLVWGPPGTGKTHFLGLTILALMAIAKMEKREIKILVTAFTHAAIENCLKMTEKLAMLHPDLMPEMEIAKIGGWRGQDKPEFIATDDVWVMKEGKNQVVGCTIFTIANPNCFPFAQKFDLVIIDEGSQLKVSDAAIPISRVDSQNGRLIISGDDKQLGPIIHGKYQGPENGEPALFGSIFDCLRQPDKSKDEYTSQLMECFRMNGTLCRFPAETIYGEKFLPASDAVAQNRIRLLGTEPQDEKKDEEAEKNSISINSENTENAHTEDANTENAHTEDAHTENAEKTEETEKAEHGEDTAQHDVGEEINAQTEIPQETPQDMMVREKAPSFRCKVRIIEPHPVRKVQILEPPSEDSSLKASITVSKPQNIQKNGKATDIPKNENGENIPRSEKAEKTKNKEKAENEQKPQNKENWLEWVLQPDYSLVLLVLDGVPALAENPVEAGLVADIAVSLRDRLMCENRLYPNDELFWQKGLFIVSPHHVQIQTIYQELYRRRIWDYTPFVDTVNKMQGQESDCVIVSYGVSDIDYALQEGEFIYSLNRLNVAITRAKAKAIVCLPSPLLTPPLSAFGQSELLEGLDFMLKLRSLMEKNGEKAQFSIPYAGYNPSTADKAKLLAFRMG